MSPRLALLLGFSLSMALSHAALAEVAPRRALVVGIDHYNPPAGTAMSPEAAARGTWTDLDGAVNDARSMRALLVERYHFADSEIHVVLDRDATRARILAELHDWLGTATGQGASRFFYYAGHGSQVRNSASPELDGYDETLVPADAATGAPDIRDKELGKALGDIAKSASLTVVLDSCHSGSATRGLSTAKQRRMQPIEHDIKDASHTADYPIDRGTLVLAAANDSQTAGEAAGTDGKAHGAFTVALLQALASDPDASAREVVLKAKALLQADGRTQEPSMEASDARAALDLFGKKPGVERKGVVIAVSSVIGKTVRLAGGKAYGLGTGSELVRTGGHVKPVRIAITDASDFASTEASVLEGDAKDVHVGDLFALTKWAPSDTTGLQVFVAPPLAQATTLDVARKLATLKSEPKLRWSDDPTVLPPSHVVAWDGAQWQLRAPDRAISLGASPTAASVLAAVRASHTKSTPVLFVSLPPTPELVASLRKTWQDSNGTIREVTEPEAHYALVGHGNGGKLEYAWVMAQVDDKVIRDGSAQPLRSAFVALDGGTATQLDTYAFTLGRVRAWQRLASPPGSNEDFPYHLVFRNVRTHDRLAPGKPTVIGDKLEVLLTADPAQLPHPTPRRYVYVFALTSDGDGVMLYPDPRGVGAGGENRLPADPAKPPAEIVLPKTTLNIVEPVGIDTYFLLTTDTPLDDTSVLEFHGVSRGTGRKVPLRGLGGLLDSVGSRAPARAPLPTEWSLERVPVKTVAGQ